VAWRGRRDPAAVELQRLVGKFALLFAFIYLLTLIAAVMHFAQYGFELLRLALIVVPGCAGVPAAFYGVRLHLTSEPTRLADLWRRCAVYAVSGLALTTYAAIAFGRMHGS
jgi:hypothetical protein